MLLLKVILLNVLLALLLVVSACDDVSDSTHEEKETNTDQDVSNDVENTEESEDTVDQVENTADSEEKDVKSEEKDSNSEIMSNAALIADFIIDDAPDARSNIEGIEFAIDNRDIFLEYKEQPIETLEDPKLMKNPNTYEDSFVSISEYVVEAREEHIKDSDVITTLQFVHYDTETVYQIIYDGSIEVYEDDDVVAEGVIAGIIRDETMDGYTADFPVIISNIVTKQ